MGIYYQEIKETLVKRAHAFAEAETMARISLREARWEHEEDC